MGKPRPSDVFKEGEKFRAERFTSIEKVKLDMKQNPDKVYVLNFWFINCPPCKQEIPELNEMVARYKDRPEVVFIGVALDASYDLKKFLKTNPFNYHIVADGRFYSEKYGVKSYPTHVIVGKDGLIKFSTIGLAPNTVHWIDKVIKEQIAPASTTGASD
ncbi:Thiol-disulfide oxidoreductase ResA [compost metagenome]